MGSNTYSPRKNKKEFKKWRKKAYLQNIIDGHSHENYREWAKMKEQENYQKSKKYVKDCLENANKLMLNNRYLNLLGINFYTMNKFFIYTPEWDIDSNPVFAYVKDKETIYFYVKNLSKFKQSHICYVAMHELFHTILDHPKRFRKLEHKDIANIAGDIVVDNMCYNLQKETARDNDMNSNIIELTNDSSLLIFKDDKYREKYGLNFNVTDSLEHIYEELLKLRKNNNMKTELSINTNKFRFENKTGNKQKDDEGENLEKDNNGEESEDGNQTSNDEDSNGDNLEDEPNENDQEPLYDEESNQQVNDYFDGKLDGQESNQYLELDLSDDDNQKYLQGDNLLNLVDKFGHENIKIKVTIGEGKNKTVFYIDLNNLIHQATSDEEKRNGKKISSYENFVENLKNNTRTLLNNNFMGRGLMPGDIVSIIEKAIEVNMPWYTILESSILYNVQQASNKRTWTKKHPYFRKVKSPGRDNDKQNRITALCAVDASGSVGDDDLAKFLGIISDTSRFFRKIKFICHDFNITDEIDIDSKTGKDEIFNKIREIKGRGGTSHQEVFERINELEKYEKISTMIFLTDFMSNVQSLKDSGKYKFLDKHKTIWVLNVDCKEYKNYIENELKGIHIKINNLDDE